MRNEKIMRLTVVIVSLMFGAACSARQAINTFWLAGTICFGLALVIYPFRKKIADMIKRFLRENRKTFMISLFALSLLFFMPGHKLMAQTADINFTPAVTTFKNILTSFSQITAGACGFYGLTRVGWLCANEDRSAGTAFILAVIGFVVATIAVGLLKF